MNEEAKRRTKRASKFIPFKKRKERICALATHVLIMPFSILYCIFLPLSFGTVCFYSGLVIFIISLVMSLMTTISFAKTPPDKPVTTGIYRISRHPIYFSGFLFFIGIGLTTASWIIILCAISWFILFHIVIPSEEQFLLEQYGDSYRDYLKKTPRWIGFPDSGIGSWK